MHRYKELHVWQKAIDLAVEVYRITEKYQLMKSMD
jgi:hypothetical protein